MKLVKSEVFAVVVPVSCAASAISFEPGREASLTQVTAAACARTAELMVTGPTHEVPSQVR
jgi:hypothetical protein